MEACMDVLPRRKPFPFLDRIVSHDAVYSVGVFCVARKGDRP